MERANEYVCIYGSLVHVFEGLASSGLCSGSYEALVEGSTSWGAGFDGFKVSSLLPALLASHVDKVC